MVEPKHCLSGGSDTVSSYSRLREDYSECAVTDTVCVIWIFPRHDDISRGFQESAGGSGCRRRTRETPDHGRSGCASVRECDMLRTLQVERGCFSRYAPPRMRIDL